MNRQLWSIVGACALGACIGTFTALDISTRFQYGSYLWGIGALLGGIVAYVAVDFRHFCAGVARAARKASNEFLVHYQIVVSWRPFRLWWKAIGGVLCATLAVWSTAVVFDASVFWVLSYIGPHTPTPFHVAGIFLGLGAFIGTVMLAVATLLFLVFFPSEDLGKKPEQSEAAYRVFLATTAREMFTAAACLNPVGLMVLGIIYLPTGSRYVVNNAPRWTRNTGEVGLVSLRAIANFVRYTFVYVHSERRTLCFVDATLGAAIGYAFGSAIIGMIAGIVAGVINYELISKRVLRIVPA